jgi:Fur family ferric uptake transcriptional regulator
MSEISTSAGSDAPARTTRQRRAVHQALEELDGFASAQDIFERLRPGRDRVGLSTVYRTLQQLADSAEVDVLRSGHHHHLVCRTCGRTVEVAGPAVEQWADRVAAEHGFRDVSHTLEVFGVCRRCDAASG